MFLQFSPPVRKPPPKKLKHVPEKSEDAVLILAPFTPIPKIFFEDVKVGETSVQRLIVRNPRPSPVSIFIELKLLEETNLQINFSTKDIVPKGEDVLTLTWTPCAAGSWRNILHVRDGGRFFSDIPIALKSVSSVKKSRTSQAKKNTLPRYVAKRNSPIQKYQRKSPQKRAVLPNITNIPIVKVSSPEVSVSFGGKENILNFSPSLVENHRRETYILGQDISDPVFEDSLEKPCSISFETLLKSECFTPPSIKISMNLEFNPELCSTDEKSMTKDITFTSKKVALFPEQNATYSLEDASVSNETYTKTNTSTETYVLEKSSSETYVMEESSSQTYIRPKQDLSMIKEELSTLDVQSTPAKRKYDLTFSAISPKRSKLSPSPFTDWSKPKPTPAIDPEIALWLEKKEDMFKRWLNGVLMPPSDLTSNEQTPLDITKLWKQCQKKQHQDLQNPIELLTNTKLNSLRKSARILYKSEEIQAILLKIWAAIDTDRFSVRSDRDIHLDLALQAEIMSILLSYHPLWLRLGLETIYNKTLFLRNNSDIVGLTTFLSEHFFKNSLLLKKFKSVLNKKYIVEIKKFILKKFLALVYFLDHAKRSKIIPHDPPLFCKNAPVKESRDALLRFSRDILSSMGDVTRYLKNFKYVVQYKQTYLDEFDYAVSCLGTDLRDGVRLTRVMERILLENDLSKHLRVPAISRLQKIHNVKLVFDVISKQNFEIKHEITPKDIVDGHKEKTLSFLWQIIYKFNTPLMARSVSIITTWWRSSPIVAKRQELKAIRKTRDEAAKKIQRWYRRIRKNFEKVRHEGAIKIQSCVRMFLVRRWFLKLKYCVSFVENTYIANRAMKIERQRFETLKSCVILVQRRWRAKLAMTTEMLKYQAQRDATIKIQSCVRMLFVRRWFLKLKYCVSLVENTYIANRAMKIERQRFETLKSCVILIQRRWRAKLAMTKEMLKYQAQRDAAIMIQRKWRATLVSRKERKQFLCLKRSVVLVQQKWRAKMAMKLEVERFQSLKASTIIIQRRFRANVAMRIAQTNFEVLKHATVIIQQQFRAKLQAKIAYDHFQKLKNATIFVQKKWRAKLIMREEVTKYKALKRAAVIIQRRFRANLAAKIEFEKFSKLKKASVMIQRKWRAKLAMRKERDNYQALKKAILVIQRRFRANLKMKMFTHRFHQLRNAAIVIQRRWKATLEMKIQIQKFIEMKEQYQRDCLLIIRIQSYVRGFLIRKKYAECFTEEAKEERRIRRMKTKAVTKIQAWWRSYKVRSTQELKMMEIRERLKIANDSALPENTLRARCKRAIEELGHKDSSVRDILRVLEDLEFITRRDKQLCSKMAEILPKHLYKTIISTNRSPPEIQVCTVAISILINFYRFKATRHKSWIPEYMENIITVALHFCDNDCPLFPTLCTLIWLFLQNKEYKSVILSTPRFEQKMAQIRGKCDRKMKMISKVKLQYISYFANYQKNCPLPSEEPDWGLELKDKPKVFTNSVFALNCILSVLKF